MLAYDQFRKITRAAENLARAYAAAAFVHYNHGVSDSWSRAAARRRREVARERYDVEMRRLFDIPPNQLTGKK